MGEKGMACRLLAPKFGGYLTFGALSPAQTSAPGQPTVGELRRLYRLHTQTPATKARGALAPSRGPACMTCLTVVAVAQRLPLPQQQTGSHGLF